MIINGKNVYSQYMHKLRAIPFPHKNKRRHDYTKGHSIKTQINPDTNYDICFLSLDKWTGMVARFP